MSLIPLGRAELPVIVGDRVRSARLGRHVLGSLLGRAGAGQVVVIPRGPRAQRDAPTPSGQRLERGLLAAEQKEHALIQRLGAAPQDDAVDVR